MVGLGNNRAFLHRLIRHPAFAAADLDTGFIERHRADLLPPAAPPSPRDSALAAVALLCRAAIDAKRLADDADPFSPWAMANGWSNTLATMPAERRDGLAVDDAGGGLLLYLEDQGQSYSLRAWPRGEGRFRLRLPDGALAEIGGELTATGGLSAWIDGARVEARAIFTAQRLTLFRQGGERAFGLWDPRQAGGIAPAPARPALQGQRDQRRAAFLFQPRLAEELEHRNL